MLHFITHAHKLKNLLTLIFTIAVLSSTGQFFYGPPITTPNIRLYEGGWCEVEINWETPLGELLGRLEQDWEWDFTGKGYWIGYTQDMYSIAARKNKAIEPLKELGKRTESSKTKYGVIATLHLIGINSTIAGRNYEIFTNGYARLALLDMLGDPETDWLILRLISRDPWYTDISYLMNYLSKPMEDYSTVLAILQRYQFPDFPFNQPLPVSTPEAICIEKAKFDHESQLFLLEAMRVAFGSDLIIDMTILNSEEWQVVEDFASKPNDEIIEWDFSFILSMLTNSEMFFSYDEIECDYFYEYRDGCMTIYGKQMAREIWLGWWEVFVNERK